MPSAETRIRIPYAAVPCASVTTIALEDLEKDDPRVAGALPAGFSLILGLVRVRRDKEHQEIGFRHKAICILHPIVSAEQSIEEHFDSGIL